VKRTTTLAKIAAALAIAGLAGCGAAPGIAPISSSAAQVRTPRTSGTNEYLYVGTSEGTSIYALPSRTLVRTIADPGAVAPSALAFDRAGNLYAANYTEHDNALSIVTAYARGTGKVLDSITSQLLIPDALAFDENGNLYVANSGDPGSSNAPAGWVTKYAPGGSGPIAKFASNQFSPSELLFDRSGNLYVGSGYGYLSVYARGTLKPLRTLMASAGPAGMQFDASGNLYTANHFGGSLTKYAPGGTSPIGTVKGLTVTAGEQELALSGQTVYVGTPTSVNVYEAGNLALRAKITAGIFNQPLQYGPSALVTDPFGNLFVATQTKPCKREALCRWQIEIFASGHTKPGAIVPLGKANPSVLAIADHD
jgi:hypothetical protein